MKKSLNPKKETAFLRGFTFLEVLAALVILSTALIPILTWVPVSIQSKLQAERKTTAIFLCQSKLEEVRYKTIKNFINNYNVGSVSFNPPYQDYRYTVNDNLDVNLKTISVKSWHIEKPQDETILYTQISRR